MTDTKKQSYSKTVDGFASLSLENKQKAWDLMRDILEQDIEQHKLLLQGQLTDLENFKETIKK